MITTSLAARLAGDGLQQYMFAAPSTVAERCKGVGGGCISSYECCPGLWCDWAFICVVVEAEASQ
ncbi:hypothetical protein [Streptomyces sp. ISL-100]|uniref:hypothetical protein n=1 Tax=Streptomyces sp. ISL-100 TaxID=2819173 RepID=UPI001BE5E081|nr:hypothetical protein [Streptomyces sp. ISL-100]MBT2396640.1 hypothetical protein [Streptomyces sp. ISL-100]